jgi:tRNA A-37 threonylcarbamoyl transferase component Bud32
MSERPESDGGGPGLVGQTLAGRYAILEEIGRGGMSVVYLARHTLINRTVAVKVLREELVNQRESISRFHREAMAAASIGNPHIVSITDYGFLHDGNAFIVMEHLEGQNLRSILRARGAMEAGRCVAIVRQILAALTAAHDRGIIHRDLKGDNVFLCSRDGEDLVKLLDFGISKVQQPLGADASRLTATGAIIGTPQYMSPEQARGQAEIDHRTDIYSLGVILFEMLTGDVPFKADSVTDLLIKQIQEPPVPPSRVRPDLGIPTWLDRVALTCLQKAPDRRYASAREMLSDLPDLPALQVAAPGPRGRRGLWLALIPIVALAAVASVLLAVGRRSSTTSDRHAPPAVAPRTRAAAPPPDRAPLDAATSVKLEVVASPAHTQILLGDVVIGTGHVSRAVPRGATPLDLRLVARGHIPVALAPVPDQDRKIVVQLNRAPGPGWKKRPAPVDPDKVDNPYRKGRSR